MASGEAKLRLYNTLTREKADFVPLDPGNVRMYVCGPTVYDYAHIGNARPVIVFDVLFRLLRHLYGASHVTYVRNITDVDDKINARAARDFPELPLNEAIRKVTEKTAAQFLADAKALGCLDPTVQPRATEHIAEMIAMTQTLIRKGNAYSAEGHVLFDVKSFRHGGELEYGKLAHRSLDDMLAGARVEVAPYKRDPMDFVLWKPSSPEEPGWESPWGRGRPGWHLECSAMSEKHLGEVFDIHGGGIDLAFPHHENELAQSRCAHGTPMMAQVWMHNGFLQVEGQKMSKSLGNFVTISELLNTDKFGGRKWPGEVLRLAMLMTHYREPIDFSVEKLEVATKVLDGWYRLVGDGKASETSDYGSRVLNELRDDLNTPEALTSLHVSADFARDPDDDNGPARFKFAANVLGLLEMTASQWFQGGRDDVVEIATLVTARLAALNAKDFATADRIRAELLEQGIQLMDSKNAAGERVTTWEVKR
ncbi:MAG: cysteine--tRNA ligase [Devosia sp.]|nr:cysteine--tRNA ligase [Devosia sp.]